MLLLGMAHSLTPVPTNREERLHQHPGLLTRITARLVFHTHVDLAWLALIDERPSLLSLTQSITEAFVIGHIEHWRHNSPLGRCGRPALHDVVGVENHRDLSVAN